MTPARDLVGGHILERRGNRVWIPAGAGCQNPKVAMESRGSVAGMLAAAVFAASMATRMASTDRIKNFRFIAFTPLRLYLQLFLTLFMALQTIGEHLHLH